MKIASAQLRLLLSVILLIAGGAIAGLAGQASGASVAADIATLSTTASYKVTGHVNSTDQEDHRGPCDDCLDCMHSGGFGCCAAGISASECGVLDAPLAIRFIAGRPFQPTGIDPEALLQPPQIFA